jgi:RNA polymerase sigma-70 factor (ECF subfamily)
LTAAPCPGTDEAELVRRIRAGDDGAFEELFHAQYAALCAFASTYLRSAEDAEDVVQNIFRSLWMCRQAWVPRGPVAVYLRTAVRNRALNVLRGARNAARCEDRIAQAGALVALAEAPPPIDEAIAAADLTAAVYDAAESLPVRCRAVFFLRWRDGCSNAEVAARLGISVKTVEMQLHRALKVLQGRLAFHR